MLRNAAPLLMVDWNILLYTTLVGLGIGLVAAAVWLDRRSPGATASRWASYTTWLIVGVGLLFLLLHLGQPARFFFVFRNWRSPLTWEAAFGLGFFLVACLYALAWRLSASRAGRQTMGLLTTFLGAGDLVVTGWQQILVSRPLWNTPVLPFLYLAWAAAMGFLALYALDVLLPAKSAGGDQPQQVATDLLRTGLWAVLAATVCGLVYMGFANGANRSAAAGLLAGAEAPLFWAHIALLVVIPLALGGLAIRRKSIGLRWAGPVIALSTIGGSLLARLLIFDVGSLVNYLP